MIKTCKKCGCEFDARRNAKYCLDCRPIVKREQDRENNRRWRKAHPEKIREYNRRQRENKRRWRKAHLEKMRECKRRWRKAHLEKMRECKRRWNKAHPEKNREYKRRQYYKNVKRKLIREILSAEAVKRDD